MQYRTYGDLKNEVLVETDTEAEDFIQTTEVKGYFQDAVNEAVALIHKLGLEDDYFLTKQLFSLTNGLQTLSMPTNIYATKIRGLIYSANGMVYPITRIKGPNRFSIIQQLIQDGASGNSRYQYQIANNSAAAGYTVELYPYSGEVTANAIAMHYIREGFRIVDGTSLIDVPQFYSFVKAYVKYKILNKEGGPAMAGAKEDLQAERELMLGTLAEMVPDYDSTIPGDYSFYEEMS